MNAEVFRFEPFEEQLAEAVGSSPLMVRAWGYRMGIELTLERTLTKAEHERLARFVMHEAATGKRARPQNRGKAKK